MLPIVIGVFILSLSGIFFNQVTKIKADIKGVSTQIEVESNTNNESTPSAEPSEIPEESKKPADPSSVTIKNGSVKTDVVINNNVNTNSNTGNTDKSNVDVALDNFKYGGASIISQSGQSLALSSSDDPDKITDWYKEKIRSLGLSSKSFVTTKSNDNVENKLVGSNGSVEIAVEIKRSGESSSSTIKITTN